jgi:hypothetical protein
MQTEWEPGSQRAELFLIHTHTIASIIMIYAGEELQYALIRGKAGAIVQ